MKTRTKILIGLLVVVLAIAVAVFVVTRGDTADLTVDEVAGTDPTLQEPDAETIPTVKIAEPVGWAADEAPTAAEGLTVMRFAEGLDHPRVIHTLPNGDVLVTLTRAPASEGDAGFSITNFIAGLLFEKAGAAGPSPDELVLLRDADGDGRAEQRATLTDELASPSGIAWNGGTLYVADHDAVLAFPYELGATSLGAPRKLMDLAPGGNHWMRNIALHPDGDRLYVAVGSASNIGEKGMEAEEGRAAIWELDLASGKARIFASGLRNPVGMAWQPDTATLWTVVNERDGLGDETPPDYLTSVQEGGFYGWPYCYWDRIVDDRDIRRHIRFGHKVVSANFDSTTARWQVTVESGAGVGDAPDIGDFLADTAAFGIGAGQGDVDEEQQRAGAVKAAECGVQPGQIVVADFAAHVAPVVVLRLHAAGVEAEDVNRAQFHAAVGRAEAVGEIAVVGEQDRLRGGVVLGLAQQVGGDPVGIVVLVGDDQDFARPGDHVDPDHAVKLALCLRDPGIARSGHDIDAGNAIRPVGERGHGLRPADAPDLVHARDMRGAEDQRVALSLGRRGRHDEAIDARDLGGNGVHQQR